MTSVELDFAGIVAENQSMVFSLALRFLRNREVAEELAQDVFLQCYRQIDRIEDAAHACSWLRRAICHRSIDELRKRRYRPAIGLDEIPEPAAAGVMPDLLLRDKLRGMVEALPERARLVVVLRYQEDLVPTEIAELLGMPVSTVKSHLHRSLALLRGRLEKKAASQAERPGGLSMTGVCL
jgi:RNA polymerase sigma-70 factor (ECF subfamily)